MEEEEETRKQDAYRHEGFPNAVLLALPVPTPMHRQWSFAKLPYPYKVSQFLCPLPRPRRIYTGHTQIRGPLTVLPSHSLAHSLPHRMSMLGKTLLLNRSTWNSYMPSTAPIILRRPC